MSNHRMSSSALPTPIKPMLAKIADALPVEPGFLFEPKWDGFRAIVFRTAEQTLLQSRDLKPLNRYFPELEQALHDVLPKGCVLDGEIVVASSRGLDFDALQQRIHPAASRIAKLAQETPASFVAFDLLGAGGKSTMELPQSERRVRLERLLGSAKPPLHLTPITRDRAEAERWLRAVRRRRSRRRDREARIGAYQPGKRAMLKIKHVRSADCVVAGFRWYKDRTDAVGSLAAGSLRRRRHAASRGRDVVVHDGDAAAAAAGAGAAARGRAGVAPVARLGPARRSATRSGCPARRAAGAAART